MQLFKKGNLAAIRTCMLCRGNLAVALLLVFLFTNTWTTMASASETRLSELLQDNLESAGLDISAISFQEDDGVVILSGRVLDAKQKQALLDLVSRTHGVRKVVDELKTDFDS